MVAYTQGQVDQGFIFQGVRRGTNNKFYGRENYKIKNKEKEETKKKNGKPQILTKAFQESHLEENQWSLTKKGCNLAMKENIILFISIHPFDLH